MKRPFLTFIVVLGLFSIACALLDEEATTVEYHEGIPVSFDIDADQLCSSGETFDCDDDAEPAPEDIELEPIELGDDIDIVEATGNSELRDITQRLRSLEITSIDYKVTDNDLTFDLPLIDLYVGPVGTDDTEDPAAIHLTTLPPTDAGHDVTPPKRAHVVDEESREKSSEQFKNMAFAVLATGQPVVREGQEMPPSGSAEVELTFNVRIVANPADEL